MDSLTFVWHENETIITDPDFITKQEGVYSFNLIVTDIYGASDSASVEITIVAESNDIPEAKVCEDYENQEVSLPHDGQPGGEMMVYLQASCSSDGDGYSLSFMWID